MMIKKSMLKRAGIALIAALLFAGCSSLADEAQSNVSVINTGVFGESAAIPVKDFETCGMVFTEHSFKSNAAENATVFTYQALLKEAQKLGADAIINVTIDRQIQKVSSDDKKFALENSYYLQETWYGSALAIKYTTVVQPNVPVYIPRQSISADNSLPDAGRPRLGIGF